MSPSVFKPVAIVGMALRGPGESSDPEKFWQMLLEGRSARSEVPKDRYNVDGFYHPDPERLGSMQVRYVQWPC
jgi:acyl transferase domain-containing protein